MISIHDPEGNENQSCMLPVLAVSVEYEGSVLFRLLGALERVYQVGLLHDDGTGGRIS